MNIGLLSLNAAPPRRAVQLVAFSLVAVSCASSPAQKLRHETNPQARLSKPGGQVGDDEHVQPISAYEHAPDSDSGAAPLPDSSESVAPGKKVDYDVPFLTGAGNLTSYLRALDVLESGDDGRVRAAHFGDSHTAADIMTTQIRRALQDRFGDGGRGFVLLGRPWRYYRPKDIHLEESGRWRPHRFKVTASSDGFDGRYGYGGVAVECDAGRCRASLRPSRGKYGDDFDFFELYYLEQPGGGSFVVKPDRGPGGRITTDAGSFASAFFALELEAGQGRSIELTTAGDGPVRLFGAVVEKKGPGIVYDTLGINGATFGTILQWDKELFVEQMQRRRPDLIVTMYGTNETCAKTFNPAEYAVDVENALQMLREGAPEAACLLIGPPDRQGKPEELERLALVVSVQRQAAKKGGCAFLNARDVMGGPGSHSQWQAQGLAASDGIHLTMQGYKQLGEEIVEILLDAYKAFSEASDEKPAGEATRPAMPGEQNSSTPQKPKEAGDDNGPT